MNDDSAPGNEKGRVEPRPWIDGLHLMLLASLAFAQPLYDILARHPQFFLIRQLVVSDLVLFLIVFSVLLPLPFLIAPIAVSKFAGRKFGRTVFASLAGVLIVLVALPLVNKIPNLLGYAKMVLAFLIGGAATVVLLRFSIVRTFLSYLSPAMLVFPVLFWTTSAAYPIASAHGGSRDVAPQISATAPIVFVVFDEFPVLSLLDADRNIDQVRFPNFAALANDAYWFRDTTTIESITATAVPAIITGRYSKKTGVGVALYSEAPENLFTLLSRQYELRIFEVATRLAPPDHKGAATGELDQNFRERFSELLTDTALVYANMILPESIRMRFPELSAGLMEIFIRADVARGQLKATANPLAAMVQNFQGASPDALKEMKESGIPDWRLYQYNQFLSSVDARPQTFYFVHSLFPHIPFRFSHTGNYYSNDMTLAGWDPAADGWHDEETPVLLAYQRHLMQVSFTDRLLGRLINRLKAAGIYKDALIVVTADHGISFRPGRSRRDRDASNHHEIANVPLFIKLPGQAGGKIDDRPVQTIDIVPSVATALEVALPWSVDGQSLFQPDGAGGMEPSRAYAGGESRPRRIGDTSFTTTMDSIDAVLKRQLDYFGSGTNNFYLAGPHKELIGRTVTSMRVEPETAAECRFRLKDSKNYERVRLNRGAIPTYITGGLGCSPKLESVAVAVNGVIRATTGTFPGYGNQLSIAAMVPENSFRAGPNSVEVYLIDRQTDETFHLRHIRRPERSE